MTSRDPGQNRLLTPVNRSRPQRISSPSKNQSGPSSTSDALTRCRFGCRCFTPKQASSSGSSLVASALGTKRHRHLMARPAPRSSAQRSTYSNRHSSAIFATSLGPSTFVLGVARFPRRQDRCIGLISPIEAGTGIPTGTECGKFFDELCQLIAWFRLTVGYAFDESFADQWSACIITFMEEKVRNMLDTNSYGRLARIFDTLAGSQAKKINLVSFLKPNGDPASDGDTDLMMELVDGSEFPTFLLDLLPMFDRLNLGQIVSGHQLPALTGLLAEIFNAASAPGDLADQLRRLFSQKVPAPVPALAGFLRNQASISLSLITSVSNVQHKDLPKALLTNIKCYFFGKDGYQTVDENYVKPPMQISGHLTDVKDLRSLTSPKNAEQYIRDIVRINGETIGDVVYELPTRYKMMQDVVGEQCTEHGKSKEEIDQAIDTAKRWFSGFSNQAEAAVMSAVEEALLGASSFQGNPLMAAAGAMAAATAARKSAQHAFLRELKVN